MNRRDWVSGGKHVAFGDERIWYRVDGDGRPTLLFTHGYPTSSHDYAAIIEALSKRYRCVSFDFLGFGASSKPRRAYSYPLQHQVLAKVVETTGVSRAVLVAHDYAVTLGQDFLAQTPSAPFTPEGVIFLNGALDPAQHRARPIQRFLASPVGRLVGARLLSRSAVFRALREVLVRKDQLDEDAAWEAITSDGGLAVMPRLLHYIAERRGRRDALVSALGAYPVRSSGAPTIRSQASTCSRPCARTRRKQSPTSSPASATTHSSRRQRTWRGSSTRL
jgi:pimeloyl-ACP methyl ester carboxylesterase